MRLLFAPLAQYDLEEISDYIALDNRPRARSFVRELRALCRKIVDNPLAFPAREEPRARPACRALWSLLDFLSPYRRHRAGRAHIAQRTGPRHAIQRELKQHFRVAFLRKATRAR